MRGNGAAQRPHHLNQVVVEMELVVSYIAALCQKHCLSCFTCPHLLNPVKTSRLFALHLIESNTMIFKGNVVDFVIAIPNTEANHRAAV